MIHFSVVVFSHSSLHSSYRISSYSIHPHRGDTLSFRLPLAPCRPLDSYWQSGTSALGARVLPAISFCPPLKGNTRGMEPTSSHFFSLGKGNRHWPSFLGQNSEFSLIHQVPPGSLPSASLKPRSSPPHFSLGPWQLLLVWPVGLCLAPSFPHASQCQLLKY